MVGNMAALHRCAGEMAERLQPDPQATGRDRATVPVLGS